MSRTKGREMMPEELRGKVDELIEAADTNANEAFMDSSHDEVVEGLLCSIANAAIAIALMMRNEMEKRKGQE